MKSKVYIADAVDNKERKFGSDVEYFPAYVVMEDGRELPALFTDKQLATAIQRAIRNPEDIPEDKNLWDMIFK